MMASSTVAGMLWYGTLCWLHSGDSALHITSRPCGSFPALWREGRSVSKTCTSVICLQFEQLANSGKRSAIGASKMPLVCAVVIWVVVGTGMVVDTMFSAPLHLVPRI
jgi:hypothetical protein